MENARDKKRKRPDRDHGKTAGKGERLLWYTVIAASVMLLFWAVIEVRMPRSAKSGPVKNELIYDYISSAMKEKGRKLLTPEQTGEIMQTVAKVLEERAADAGEVSSADERKLLVKQELLREYGWLTQEELDILLSQVDVLLQNGKTMDAEELIRRQQLLEEGLAGAQNSLMQKAQQEDILGLQEQDRELAERMDGMDKKLDSQSGHNDKVTDEFGNLAERTDQRLEQLWIQVNQLTAQLGGSLEDLIRKNQEDIAKHDLEALEFKKAVEERLQACFQSVSSAKGLLASTLTDKGVDTKADAEFAVINNHIKELYTKAFTAGADSVSGANAEVEYEYHYHVDGSGHKTNDTASGQQYAKAGGCYTKPIYHRHQAGCFGRCARQGQYLRHEKNGKYHQWFYNCPVHGEYMHQALHEGDGVGSTCTYDVQNCSGESAVVGYGCGCGMVEAQILSATIVFARPGTLDADPEAAMLVSGSSGTEELVQQLSPQEEQEEKPEESEYAAQKEVQAEETAAQDSKTDESKSKIEEPKAQESKTETDETMPEEPGEKAEEEDREKWETESDETLSEQEPDAEKQPA